MAKLLIHHAEIGLKKGNFPFFERKLVENIKESAEKNEIKINGVKRHEKRILIDFSSSDKGEISEFLSKIFGIKYFSFVSEIEINEKKLKNKIENILKQFKKNNVKKVAFQTKRSDKRFPLTSVEINKKLGEISNKLELKVDYVNFEKKIFIEVTEKKIYVYTEREEGLGGLPVGTSGKVLVLLSGGIDSPVASWLMMKRGCATDFLHFHTFNDNKKAFNSKLKKFVDKLSDFQGKSKIYFVPYSVYEAFTQGAIQERYDLVLFKYFMLKFADKFAEENKYGAIVLGDNLGQVASQTMENINATSFGIKSTVFRPLLTYDKQEIIDLSKKVGTYDLSIEKYKDCCSILSKGPATKTKLGTFRNILERIDIDKIIEKSLKEIGGFEVK